MPNASLFGQITRCQICENSDLRPIFSLGSHPPTHSYLTKKELNEPEMTYPLSLCRCSSCGLVQLSYAVDPKILFSKEYPYHTGMTNMLVRNFRSLTDILRTRYFLTKEDLVIDIGSNDGTLLGGFLEHDIRVLGVEPTNAASVAINNGIPTVQKFFSENIAREILKQYGKAKVITATNVFAHINNLYDFLRGVHLLLDDNGVFVSESQYLMDIYEKLEFDTIYHEHLRFYSLKPLITLFSRAGFSVIDAERISAAGGSIRVYAMKGKHSPSKSAEEIIRTENEAEIYKEETWVRFAARAKKAKYDLLALLTKCKQESKRIVGISSPARANTLMGFTRIDQDILDYACERSGSPKIGLFTPGMHISVVDEEKLFLEQPEYALILSWHIGEELMKKLREKGYRGKFIMPLPEPRIVTNT